MTNERISSFYAQEGLATEIYDVRSALHISGSPVEGDEGFYLERARSHDGPVLDVGCGTGRIAIALAEHGHRVTGIDSSAPMLRAAGRRVATLAPDIQGRIDLRLADMADFSLEGQFGLIITPFRSFQFLLTAERQRAALLAMRRHLPLDGELVLDLFDPRLDLCVPTDGPLPSRRDELRHPVSGNLVVIEVTERVPDPQRQLIAEVWRTTESGPDGSALRSESESLVLRWTLRPEMRHLLELTGFAVVAEYGDFRGSPPTYGREQVWVVRRSD